MHLYTFGAGTVRNCANKVEVKLSYTDYIIMVVVVVILVYNIITIIMLCVVI